MIETWWGRKGDVLASMASDSSIIYAKYQDLFALANSNEIREESARYANDLLSSQLVQVKNRTNLAHDSKLADAKENEAHQYETDKFQYFYDQAQSIS